MQDPTESPLLEGRWRLLFTTRPGSASPIQKTFVGVESFTVYQEVLLTSAERARVNNVVDFGAKIGTLKVICTAGSPHGLHQSTLLSFVVSCSHCHNRRMHSKFGKSKHGKSLLCMSDLSPEVECTGQLKPLVAVAIAPELSVNLASTAVLTGDRGIKRVSSSGGGRSKYRE